MKPNVKDLIIIVLSILMLLLNKERLILLVSQNKELVKILILLVILISILCVLLYLLDHKQNTGDSATEKKIETGYEVELANLLESSIYNSMLINGRFGVGKTTILNQAFRNANVSENEILRLKFYEEYSEENYIEYLYGILSSKASLYKRFLNIVKEEKFIILVTLIIIVAMFENYSYNNFSDNSFSISTYIILPIIYIIYEEVKMKKQDKIKLIKRELDLFKYIVIDDLDRTYTDTTEIMKLIQFLNACQNITNYKLILLGDKDTIKNENINYVEKYYDLMFEVPEDILSSNLAESIKDSIWNTIQVDEIDREIYLISKIEIRKIKKILNYIEFIKNSDLQPYIQKLDLGNWLFVLMLYIDNKVDMLKFFSLISEVSKIEFYAPEKKQVVLNKKMSDIQNSNINLSDDQIEYLLDMLANYFSLERNVLSGSIGVNRIVKKKMFNGLFDNPKNYKLNSYLSDDFSVEAILSCFEEWAKNDPDKINQQKVSQYCNYRDIEEMCVIIFDAIENYNNIQLYSYIKDEIYRFPNIAIDYPNVYFLDRLGKHDEGARIEFVNEMAVKWSDLSARNKLILLGEESRLNIARRDKDVLKLFSKLPESEANEILDIYIEANFYIKYPYIYKSDFKGNTTKVEYMHKLYKLILTELKNKEDAYFEPEKKGREVQKKLKIYYEQVYDFSENK